MDAALKKYKFNGTEIFAKLSVCKAIDNGAIGGKTIDDETINS